MGISGGEKGSAGFSHSPSELTKIHLRCYLKKAGMSVPAKIGFGECVCCVGDSWCTMNDHVHAPHLMSEEYYSSMILTFLVLPFVWVIMFVSPF
jgi:hypothetical protein